MNNYRYRATDRRALFLFWSFSISAGLFFYIAYSTTFLDSGIELLSRIDEVQDPGLYGFHYLDDSAKYTLYLFTKTPLVVFHGGLGLELIATLIYALCGDNSSLYSYAVFLIYFAISLQIVSSFDRINPLLLVLSFPFFAQYLFLLNKEIPTVLALIVIARPGYLKFLASSIFPSSTVGIWPRFVALSSMIICLFCLVFLVLSRPALLLMAVSFSALLAFISFFVGNRVSLSFVKPRSRDALFALALLCCGFSVAYFIPGSINLLISWHNSQSLTSSGYDSALAILFALPYSLVAPFPLSFAYLGSFLFGLDDPVSLLYGLFMVVLGALGFVRLFFIFKILCGFSVSVINFSRSNRELLVYVLLLVLTALRADEITRQLITLSIPFSYALSKVRLRSDYSQ